MEKEGLCHVIKFLKEQKVSIGVIVTDRHKHINQWLRETHPNIKYFYDVWHIAKGKISLIKSILLGTCSVWKGQRSGLAPCKILLSLLDDFCNTSHCVTRFTQESTGTGGTKRLRGDWKLCCLVWLQ